MLQPRMGLFTALLVLCLEILGCSASGGTRLVVPAGTTTDPACKSPSPYQAMNPHVSKYAGLLEVCVDISAKPLMQIDNGQAFDLGSLQVAVADECFDAVEHVSFGGKTYKPAVTKNETYVGVKINDQPALATYRQLAERPMKACIQLRAPCLTKASVLDVLSFFPAGNCDGYEVCATAPVMPTTPASTLARSLQTAQSFAGFLQHRKLLQNCGDDTTGCPVNAPSFQCGTDQPGCDIVQFPAPNGARAPNTKFVPVTASFTVQDCCLQCYLTPHCSTFIVRLGVCFLKPYSFRSYPPNGAPDNPYTCPPIVDGNTRIGDVQGLNTVIGSVCTCAPVIPILLSGMERLGRVEGVCGSQAQALSYRQSS